MYPQRGHVQQRRWSDVERGDVEEKQNGSPKLHRLKSNSDEDWDWDMTTKLRDSNEIYDDDSDENEFLMNFNRIEQVRNGSSMLTWKERLGLCIQLCSGVSYLHRQVPIILHRDLKPHNVLLSKDFCVKICDFGESTRFSRKNKTGRRLHPFHCCLPSCIEKKVLKSERDELELLSDVELPLTIRGSPLWCAPEVLVGLHGVSQYGVRADVYSLTIMIWQILTLEPLYEGMSLFDVMERVVHHNVRPRVPMTWSSNLRDSMKSGWNAVSRNRCTARDLMDALLLEYNKERKISSVA
jgi:serine/threonine protein kinase